MIVKSVQIEKALSKLRQQFRRKIARIIDVFTKTFCGFLQNTDEEGIIYVKKK
mgnify:CR=1 FL=1